MLWLAADGLHDGSRCGEPARYQAARDNFYAAYLCLHSRAVPP